MCYKISCRRYSSYTCKVHVIHMVKIVITGHEEKVKFAFYSVDYFSLQNMFLLHSLLILNNAEKDKTKRNDNKNNLSS